MALLERVASRAVTLLFPPLLLLSNLYLLLTPAFIDFQYFLDLPPAERFTQEERVFWTKKNLEYLVTAADISSLAFLSDDRGPLYNQRELTHMVDAKALLQRFLLIHAISLVLAGAAIIYLLVDSRRSVLLAQSLLSGSLFTIVLFGGIAIFAVLAFDLFLDRFHRLFFTGESWIFSYSDTLIQLTPPAFYYNAVLVLGALALGEAAIVGLLAYLWKKDRGEA